MHFAVLPHLILVKSKITAQILKCVCLPCNWATQPFYTKQRTWQAIHVSGLTIPSLHKQIFRNSLGFIYLSYRFSLAPLHYSLRISPLEASKAPFCRETEVQRHLQPPGTSRDAQHLLSTAAVQELGPASLPASLQDMALSSHRWPKSREVPYLQCLPAYKSRISELKSVRSVFHSKQDVTILTQAKLYSGCTHPSSETPFFK